MPPPIGGRDLVFDQRVHRGGVGHAQQRLGQAHQGDAFVGGQAVFGEKHVHQARFGGTTDLAHKVSACGDDPRPRGGIQTRICDQGGDQRAFIGKALGVDDVARVDLAVTGHGNSPAIRVAYTEVRGLFS